ncbi:MAG: sulfite reductase, partial [Actinobacteria bacterium HGW-Actinobacteria-5]
FREVLEHEYLGYALADGPAPVPSGGPGDHVGVHAQKDGRVWVGLAPTVGRVSGQVLAALADAAEAAGSGRVRFTPQQKLLVLDVDPGRTDDLLAAVEPLGLTANPSPFRRSTMACTGIEFCKLAFVETKATAAHTIDELERRLDGVDLGTPISLHVNGCPNSCARIQVADIGLKGQLIKGQDGSEEFAYQVHLGGGLASVDRDEAGLGRTVRGLKVSATDLPDYVERVTRAFVAAREPGESFAQWAHRADEETLR